MEKDPSARLRIESQNTRSPVRRCTLSHFSVNEDDDALDGVFQEEIDALTLHQADRPDFTTNGGRKHATVAYPIG